MSSSWPVASTSRVTLDYGNAGGGDAGRGQQSRSASTGAPAPAPTPPAPSSVSLSRSTSGNATSQVDAAVLAALAPVYQGCNLDELVSKRGPVLAWARQALNYYGAQCDYTACITALYNYVSQLLLPNQESWHVSLVRPWVDWCKTNELKAFPILHPLLIYFVLDWRSLMALSEDHRQVVLSQLVAIQRTARPFFATYPTFFDVQPTSSRAGIQLCNRKTTSEVPARPTMSQQRGSATDAAARHTQACNEVHYPPPHPMAIPTPPIPSRPPPTQSLPAEQSPTVWSKVPPGVPSDARGFDRFRMPSTARPPAPVPPPAFQTVIPPQPHSEPPPRSSSTSSGLPSGARQPALALTSTQRNFLENQRVSKDRPPDHERKRNRKSLPTPLGSTGSASPVATISEVAFKVMKERQAEEEQLHADFLRVFVETEALVDEAITARLEALNIYRLTHHNAAPETQGIVVYRVPPMLLGRRINLPAAAALPRLKASDLHTAGLGSLWPPPDLECCRQAIPPRATAELRTPKKLPSRMPILDTLRRRGQGPFISLGGPSALSNFRHPLATRPPVLPPPIPVAPALDSPDTLLDQAGITPPPPPYFAAPQSVVESSAAASVSEEQEMDGKRHVAANAMAERIRSLKSGKPSSPKKRKAASLFAAPAGFAVVIDAPPTLAERTAKRRALSTSRSPSMPLSTVMPAATTRERPVRGASTPTEVVNGTGPPTPISPAMRLARSADQEISFSFDLEGEVEPEKKRVEVIDVDALEDLPPPIRSQTYGADPYAALLPVPTSPLLIARDANSSWRVQSNGSPAGRLEPLFEGDDGPLEMDEPAPIEPEPQDEPGQGEPVAIDVDVEMLSDDGAGSRTTALTTPSPDPASPTLFAATVATDYKAASPLRVDPALRREGSVTSVASSSTSLKIPSGSHRTRATPSKSSEPPTFIPYAPGR